MKSGFANFVRFASILLAGGALALPLTAHAADGRVSVELKDGSSLRGEVVEKVPGKVLKVQLAGGEVRTIAWESIARIEEPPAAKESQPSDSAAAAPVPNGVTIHLDADDPHATLQRRMGTSMFVISTARGTATGAGEAWEDVCVSPCDAQVPKNQTVRVAGDGVTPSANFVLQRDAKLDAKTGSAGLRVGGIWLTSLGLTAALTGGLLLALNRDGVDGEPMFSPTLTYGLLGGGALVTGGGIAMIASSGTSVRDERGTNIATGPTPPKAFVIPATFAF
ncbi:hypothetical protein AKJ09_02688 [Labilithrix luteola]|uniref:Uncharacterized protein n=1 Tax=Labilithrix luteola TaxID=1391654 RepID=A0A0K1PSB6_9BACT|nr:hypothetical protein [Labilithrix luteola]AKU96024.1 hypothetical protein AKJ09_02688 [Labilithrix luteola]